jgi:hypothetical protein
MKSTYKYLIIFTVGIFFMISACEVSTKYFTNTFDDEYDYYLPSDNQSILPVINILLYYDFVSTLCINLAPNLNYNCTSENILKDFQLQFPPKLFLKTSLLLI